MVRVLLRILDTDSWLTGGETGVRVRGRRRRMEERPGDERDAARMSSPGHEEEEEEREVEEAGEEEQTEADQRGVAEVEAEEAVRGEEG